ncbi:Protein of unknown function [Rathayibacter rathayi NCPPB 2980 = VKM Ac-1601]|nr:HNH endonuclease family protein [Rathayibacter rathayi]TWD63637.1 uncharacterized protein DUF1524 [Rathayibacter rathayi]SOE05856.1 Protein of unknown function [Rathayibacter rathayi NCPPB 2980 = VKM Ac-1601]
MTRGRRLGITSALVAAAIAAAASLLSLSLSLPGADAPTPTPSRLETGASGPAGPLLTRSGLATMTEGKLLVDGDAVRALAMALPEAEPSTSATEAWAPLKRDHFGQRWADVDHNGCDTRNDILGRDLRSPQFQPGTRDCKVIAGVLEDPYTGQSIPVDAETISKSVQIDHVVPLHWAWLHGADKLTDDQRRQLANDPDNLAAVASSANAAKSDSGPAEWLPRPEDQCSYVATFTAVLQKYSLTIDPADRSAIVDLSNRC